MKPTPPAMTNSSPQPPPVLDPRQAVRALLDAQTAKGRHKWRAAKDRFARHAIGLGGSMVIFAVLLIFFYLLSVVAPVFRSAKLTPESVVAQALPNAGLAIQVDEYGELLTHVDRDGQLRFIKTDTGANVSSITLPLPAGVIVQSVAVIDRASGRLALGLSNGSALVITQSYALNYGADGKRIVTPSVAYPYGETAISIDTQARPLQRLTGSVNDDGMSLAAVVADNTVVVAHFVLDTNMLEDTVELSLASTQTITPEQTPEFLLIDPTQHWLYLAAVSGKMESWRVSDDDVRRVETLHLTDEHVALTEMQFLLGGISILSGDSDGRITQWLRVRDSHNEFRVQRARDFRLGNSAITHIAGEPRRKGFAATNLDGQLGVFYTTSQRQLLSEKLPEPVAEIAWNARSTRLLTVTESGNIQRMNVDNPHPEISVLSLWQKIWYESYDEPSYTWQSSAATDDFEPKMSLVPLVFGTLKAAIYAMLFALPIGICAAMYTAYFMAPALRGVVKPMVEIMAAMPSVILGFLAGLWLAPLLEANLPGVFALLLLMPLTFVGFGWAWQFAPNSLRHRIPHGWHAALLIPIVVLLGWSCFALSPLVEQLLFNGNARAFVTDTLHINFEQRNSLVVGIAMGFAVIPSIFSMAEDAVFAVPKGLVNGSLALGASPWQTMARVVLPTASPGIFSAVMIGFGRAVGETMIVLMATGNTPIMHANIFDGLRSLSANIAVEMPEAEVGSSHYRVLFIAALVLFLFTFIFNTLAEVVRTRLRRKYGSL